jgi:hypothetical protein
MEAIAGLAGTTWKQADQADRTQPIALVEPVLEFQARQPFEGVDEPVQIYLTRYHVLRDFGDLGAGNVLQRAHDGLIANAALHLYQVLCPSRISNSLVVVFQLRMVIAA